MKPIKYLIFLSLLAGTLTANSAQNNSDWIYVAESSKSKFEFFYSALSVKRDGRFINVKILKNFEGEQEFTAEKPFFKFLSSVETQIINCDNKTYRNTRSEKWSDKWGLGALGRAYDYLGKKENAWSGVIQDSQIEGALMAKVCV